MKAFAAQPAPFIGAQSGVQKLTQALADIDAAKSRLTAEQVRFFTEKAYRDAGVPLGTTIPMQTAQTTRPALTGGLKTAQELINAGVGFVNLLDNTRQQFERALIPSAAPATGAKSNLLPLLVVGGIVLYAFSGGRR